MFDVDGAWTFGRFSLLFATCGLANPLIHRRVASFAYLQRTRIRPLQAEVLHIHADMTEGQARHLAQTQQGNRVRVLLNGLVLCRVRDFSLVGRSMETGNAELI
jgi:hypothetical protein